MIVVAPNKLVSVLVPKVELGILLVIIDTSLELDTPIGLEIVSTNIGLI
jgi:hypothetical protein